MSKRLLRGGDAETFLFVEYSPPPRFSGGGREGAGSILPPISTTKTKKRLSIMMERRFCNLFSNFQCQLRLRLDGLLRLLRLQRLL